MDGRSRFDRLLGILLVLRGGQAVTAAEIAGRFGVSRRTVHRDMDALSALGIPVYAERGRGGGFRLLPGYFLPPIMFSEEEAIALVLGLLLLGNLHAAPHASALESAERKLLAAVPDRLRATLASARRIVGFERVPDDVFHPEPQDSCSSPLPAADQGDVVSLFLRAVLARRRVTLDYRSPYRGATHSLTVSPCGLFWDRGRWYLVGVREAEPDAPGLWRADRVLAITLGAPGESPPAFDVRALLDRQWLAAAMAEWADETPVRIRMTSQQADRLRRDWLYQHARYEPAADGAVIVNIGENTADYALELVRWLGPGAELIEPAAWRGRLRAELTAMLADYDGGSEQHPQ
jgi:predicted DNA-binding transcriptional regulator YafY